MRLVEDNPASLSLLDVFKLLNTKQKIEYDAAICRYYEKLGNIQVFYWFPNLYCVETKLNLKIKVLTISCFCFEQSKGGQINHQVMRDILRDIQTNLVPRTMFREWALSNFSTPSDYWMFRKIVSSYNIN
jgi:transformation/transcription domain-associated protein